MESNNKDSTSKRAGRARARKRRRWVKRLLLAAAAVIIVGLGVLAAIPSPIAVDTARAERSAITSRLLETGKTRVRDRYIVRAPIAGDLERVTLWPGDQVVASAVVVRLRAIAPPLLSAQDRRLAQARLAAARAGLDAARNESKRAGLAVEKLRGDVERVEKLVSRGASPEARLIELRHALRDAKQAAISSKFRVSVAAGERKAAEAALGLNLKESTGGAIELHAPIAGTVLRVHRRDSGPVAPGEPLIELGDLRSLEIVVDVLTSDAISIPPNAPVNLHGFGEVEGAVAEVSHVEPAGFTRISALGVDEQRVNVIARFASPPPIRLGDAFGVDAEIILEQKNDALIVPLGALFRRGDGWVTYKVSDGEARLAPVTVGVRSDFGAEIVAGLEEGDEVILHPSDEISEGTSVERR